MKFLPPLNILGQHRAIGLGVILIGCYLMFSPVWAPAFTQEIYDRARLLQLGLLWSLVVLMLVPAVAAAVTRAWSRLNGGVRTSVVVLLGVGALSAAKSGAPHVGILQVGLMAMMLVLTMFTIAAVRMSRQTSESTFTFCVTAGATLFVLNFWLTYGIFHLEGKPFSWASPFFKFANVRFFGQYQAYALLLVTLPLIVYRLGFLWRILLYFVAASFWSYQWILNSRALWAGIAAAAFLALVFPTKARLRWLGEQGLLVLLGGFVSLLFHTPGTGQIPSAYSIVERGTQSISERVILARSAVGMIEQSPLLGVGPGQFGLHYSETRAAHPHNSVLQLLAEYGLVAGLAAIVLLGSLLFFALHLMWRKPRDETDMVSFVLAAALFMGLCDSVFSGNLTMPHSQVLFFLLAGWIVGRACPEVAAQVSPIVPTVRTVLAGVGMLAGMATLLLTVEYLGMLGDAANPVADRVPSFWQYGRFDSW